MLVCVPVPVVETVPDCVTVGLDVLLGVPVLLGVTEGVTDEVDVCELV